MSERCHEIEAMLSPYLDGELEDDAVRRVEEHVRSCEACRAKLRQWREAESVLAATVPARSDLEWERLAQRVEAALEKDELEEVAALATAVGAAERAGPLKSPSRASKAGAGRRLRADWLWTVGSGAIAAAALVLLFWPWVQDRTGRTGTAPPLPVTGGGRGPEKPELTLKKEGLREEEGNKPAGTLDEREHKPTAMLDEVAILEPKVPAPAAAGRSRAAPPPQPEPSREHAEKSVRTLGYVEPGDNETWAEAERQDDKLEATPAPSEVDAVEEGLASGAASRDREPASGPETSETRGTYPISIGKTSLDDGDEVVFYEIEPSTPEGGAASIEEIAAWLAGAEPVAGYGRALEAPEVDRVTARIDQSAERSDEQPLDERALRRAHELRDRGDREGARRGYTLLTGPASGERVRDEAWYSLTELQTEDALASGTLGPVLEAARSLDAFLLEFPDSARRRGVLDNRVRVWRVLTGLDPIYCPAAQERVQEWQQGLETVRRELLEEVDAIQEHCAP